MKNTSEYLRIDVSYFFGNEYGSSLHTCDKSSRFHSKLGMALINASKGDDLDDATVLTIVCQLNRNLLSLKQSSSSVRTEVSSLNYKSGVIAMNRSDYETASHYFSLASQMLPDNHWESNYELSLKLNIATAKATYSTGNTDKSQAALDIILKEATCMEDKLDAYSLVAFIHHSQERGEEAYTTCQDVLTQLGEEIPECVTPEENKKFIEETTLLLSDLSKESLQAMNEMDTSMQTAVKFFSFMAQIAWFSRPEVSFDCAFIFCCNIPLVVWCDSNICSTL
jgi:predicted ATPase